METLASTASKRRLAILAEINPALYALYTILRLLYGFFSTFFVFNPLIHTNRTNFGTLKLLSWILSV